MDMNLFRNYLEDINNSLNKPQRGLTPIMEATKKTAGKYAPAKLNVGEEADAEFSAEDIVNEYLTSYFGGELTEDTTDDYIIEAINVLNTMANSVNEWVDSDSDDITEEVLETLNNLLDGNLNEDTSSDDIADAIMELNLVAEVVNDYFISD